MLNIKGKKFGLLTAVEQIKDKNNKTTWKCLCDCGNITTATAAKLNYGHTKSCGCIVGRTHKHKTNKNHHCWRGYGNISGVTWKKITLSAKKRNLEINITIQDIWNLFLKQNGKCAISGVELYIANNYKEKSTASLDRIDSTKGYIYGNVQWVHINVNFMKQEFNQQLFIDWCNKINNHQKEKP